MIPTFGGVAIFGRAVTIVPEDVPYAFQEQSYAGVNGVKVTALGTRGFLLHVEGMLAGTTMLDLVINHENAFRTYRDGVARTLVDVSGNPINNVVCERFDVQGPIRYDAFYGFFRRYKALFKALK